MLRFWFDNWCSDGPLRSLVQGPLPLEEEKLKVKEVVTVSGWNWSKISIPLSDNVSTKLKATPVSLAAQGQDRLSWGMSTHGGFDLKSAYKLAIGGGEGESSFTGQWVWKTNILPRIQTFVWMCLHNSIGVKECLTRRGVQVDPTCPLCLSQSESIIHALRECRIVKSFWSQLKAEEVNTSFFSGNLHQWLTTNGRADWKKQKDHPPWRTSFLFAIWRIWKHRNQVVFHNKPIQQNLGHDIFREAMEYEHCVKVPRETTNQVVKRIRWEKPEAGWFRLNSDGSLTGNPGLAGSGGLIRNAEGDWVCGYARKIGVTTSFAAELWGLRNGLLQCFNLHLSAVEIEIDAKAIVDLLNNSKNASNVTSALVEDYRYLISQLPHTRIKHCFREANQCADALARLGSNQTEDFCVFSSPPVDIIDLLKADSDGLYLNRLCIEPVLAV